MRGVALREIDSKGPQVLLSEGCHVFIRGYRVISNPNHDLLYTTLKQSDQRTVTSPRVLSARYITCSSFPLPQPHSARQVRFRSTPPGRVHPTVLLHCNEEKHEISDAEFASSPLLSTPTVVSRRQPPNAMDDFQAASERYLQWFRSIGGQFRDDLLQIVDLRGIGAGRGICESLSLPCN